MCRLLAFLFAFSGWALAADPLPSPAAMAASREDLWGEAAIKAGPSYEFYRDLLPPLRYVNTAFKHYPITLSAPQATVKARWISNGSGVNLKADKLPMWREVGIPVAFFVGDKGEAFGADPARLTALGYAIGWLPNVGVSYKVDGVTYRHSAFAPVRGLLAEHGALFVKFSTNVRESGKVTARLGTGEQFNAKDGTIRNDKGNTIAMHSKHWTWDAAKNELRATTDFFEPPELVIFTKPVPQPPEKFPSFKEERDACVEAWETLLLNGATVQIPERVVHKAWRALVAGQYLISAGDRMNYSAGNAYDHLYEGECGDAVRSLLLNGYATEAKAMIGPLLDFDRKATRFHVAGHKLQLLTHYYWVTRDKEYIEQTRPKWEPVAAFIRANLKTENGLLPKDNFAGDVNTQVYSLNSNANCWRGLRDLAAVLEDIGDKTLAAELKKEAAEFRKVIESALVKSIREKEKFIPLSLLSDEPAHDPITATRMGSYYNLMIPYVLGSGILGDEKDGMVIDYLRTHGGLAMGMIRSMPHQGEFDKQPGVNPLYGLRYNLTLLRRGDRDHALAGFYGLLAQGMTRDTFIGGEASRFFHGDAQGRSFYLPPNSASNATFLTTLRYLLVQDWDMNDDGVPDTLRIGDAIPPQWLADGAEIRLEKLPSAFGEVSYTVKSDLKQPAIVVTVQAPPRPVAKWTLRLPDPPGHSIASVKIGGVEVKRDVDGRVDLTGHRGVFDVQFALTPR